MSEECAGRHAVVWASLASPLEAQWRKTHSTLALRLFMLGCRVSPDLFDWGEHLDALDRSDTMEAWMWDFATANDGEGLIRWVTGDGQPPAGSPLRADHAIRAHAGQAKKWHTVHIRFASRAHKVRAVL